jgi:hypothetical protein
MKLRAFVPALLAASLVFAANAQPTQPPPLRKLTLEDAVPDAHGVKRLAVLRALDKITGRATDIETPAGVAVRFGTLSVTLRYCYTRPPEEPPETTAFLQIDEVRAGHDPTRLFSGWMFASTPALHALEHAVYDVWVISCRTNAPAPAPPPAATPAPGKVKLKPPPSVAPAPAAVPPAAPEEEPAPEPKPNP